MSLLYLAFVGLAFMLAVARVLDRRKQRELVVSGIRDPRVRVGGRPEHAAVHARSMIDRTMSGRSKCSMWPALGRRTVVLWGAAIAEGNRTVMEAGVSASCSPNM